MSFDKLFDGSDAHQLIHVVPTNDLREHIESTDCWCSPTLDEEDFIVIHNSIDEREQFEEGRKLS